MTPEQVLALLALLADLKAENDELRRQIAAAQQPAKQ